MSRVDDKPCDSFADKILFTKLDTLEETQENSEVCEVHIPRIYREIRVVIRKNDHTTFSVITFDMRKNGAVSSLHYFRK